MPAAAALLQAPPRGDAGDGRTYAEFRASLAAADFTAERIESTFGTHALSAQRSETAVYVRRLGDDAFSSLARLFLLGVAVERRAAEAALAPFELAALVDLGLARVSGSIARAAVRLVPHGEYLVASDVQPETGDLPADFVAGIQAPSVMLAKLVVRRAVRSALDLGTGCGIQALLAAKHCERVVATDVNERALAFADFNACLNGIDRIEVRHGDGFEPVQDERFDLVISNPPYVVSPDVEYLYRDNALRGDELCRRLVETAPAVLADGGFAHLLVSWLGSRDDWAAPLRAWVAGSGCDAWLLHYKTEDPLTHAGNWLGPLADDDVERFERELDRWLAYLRELDAEAVSYGAIVLRRRAGGRDWTHADVLPLDRLEPASDHTLRVFAANDYLHGLAAESALLDASVSLTERHRLEQTLRCEDGGFRVDDQTLGLEDGLAFRIGVDRYTASLLPHLDGTTTVREAARRAAAGLALGPNDSERFISAAIPVVRRLLELGFLELPA